MNTYSNGSGQWVEHNGFRVEVYNNGTWVVCSMDGSGRTLASADDKPAKDIEGAKDAARKAYEQLRKR